MTSACPTCPDKPQVLTRASQSEARERGVKLLCIVIKAWSGELRAQPLCPLLMFLVYEEIWMI